jgi:hypothetical protein
MMKRSYGSMAVVGGVLCLFLITGCSTTPPYQVGDVERIRCTFEESHWQWVEMPNEPPGKKDGRVIKKEIVLRREVESVNEQDHSAVMKITLEKVDIGIKTLLPEKERNSYYRSSAEKTESNIPNSPTLAGAIYKIRLAPDTTVLEIIGLEELRTQLKMKDENITLATPELSPEAIKQIHEREFLQCGIKPGKKIEKLGVIPHMMIKAQAIKHTYSADRGRSEGEAKWVTVTSAGEALHTLPEGWEEPPGPTDPSRLMMKSMFDMQKLEVTSKGVFDANNNRVKSEQKHIFCSLVLLGEKIDSKNPQALQKKKGGSGEMFVEITVNQTFEVLPE